MRRGEDVLDLRGHADAGLADALALGLRAVPGASGRGLMVLLGTRGPLSPSVVRLLAEARFALARSGQRCVVVMPVAGAVSTALAHRASIPWVSSREEARALLRRSRVTVRLRRHDLGRTLRATLGGELDVAALPAVRGELDAIIKHARPGLRIVCDLSGLAFTDTHGLEAITHVVVRSQLAGARIEVVGASAQVRALAYRLDWHRQLPGLNSSVDDGAPPVPALAREPTRRAIIATDLRGLVTYWDSHAHDLYDWSEHEVLGRPIDELTVQADATDVAGEIMAGIRAHGAWEGTFPVHGRDEDPFDAYVRNATIDDGLGTPVGVVGYSLKVPNDDE